ncbi:MAG: tetrahydromethanopterin S-methyltransferase subunit H [Chloroflexota bacterium]|nr:tetrahydromethanopterin S-methyltransferase subunit H [Chloroflexota bacterium]
MLKFNADQKVTDIAGVEVGGQPGERPTVLIGSIFFSGHRIVSDSLKGVFDKDKARTLLDREAEAAARTSNPRLIDVIGDTAAALINYIEFVAAHSDAPILVDSFSQKVRLEAVRHFAGTEVVPRLVYNSIAEDYTEEELACLRECGVKSAVILAFSTAAPRPKSRIKLLQETLLPAAERAGLENILVDLGVLDIPSVGWTALAIREVKDTLGYPAGCAPSNALYTWEKLRAQGRPAFEAAAASVFALAQNQGADFLFYGPIRNAPWVFSAAATVDAMMAYTGRFTGVRPVTDDHPLYKIF